MIVFFDVYYQKQEAQVAAVWAKSWEQEQADGQKVLKMSVPSDYEPGAFYKRELPCLLAMIEQLPIQPSCLVVDGYVFTSEDTLGLGAHLYHSLPEQIPVIGIAKSLFRLAEPVSKPVLRGKSQNPLWVSAIDFPLEEAVANLQNMHGEHRTPTLLKLVDRLSRP